MVRDPQSTDGHTAATMHPSDRRIRMLARESSSRGAIAVVTIVLLSALLFGVLATRRYPNAGPGAISSVTSTVGATATTSPAATPTPQPLQASTSVVSMAMVSASDGWAIAAPSASSAALAHYTGGRWMLSGDSYAGVYLTD